MKALTKISINLYVSEMTLSSSFGYFTEVYIFLFHNLLILGNLKRTNQLYEMSLSFISMYFKEYYKGKSFKTYTKISKSK